MSIHEHGYWQGVEASSQHMHDSPLGDSLTNFLKTENVNSVADFGCGMGDYVKTFKSNNINASGFDGNPNTPELTNYLCNVLDLSVPHRFDTQFDWIMSLEVGEHLPQQFEDIFIHNLHNNNKYGIILSWAVKGQGGHGHYNEQNNDYIKSKICELGYINDVESENKLRNDSTLPWFKNTIMIFRKKYYYNQDNYNLCLLYNKPENLNANILQLPTIHNIGSYTNDYRKYFNNIEKTKFMIDIGANIGLSACPVLSLGYKVFCFEPELLNVEILNCVKEKNNYDNMSVSYTHLTLPTTPYV